MRATIEEVGRTRDVIHNLDPAKDRDLIKQQTEDFIVDGEGRELRVYDDKRPKIRITEETEDSEIKGKRTIGYGFNMDQEDAEKLWNECLPDVSFHDARTGSIEITQKQAKKLLRYMISTKEELAKRHYADVWDKLKPNEQLFIINGFYNTAKIVKNGTNFHKYIVNYVKTGDKQYLLKAVDEIKYRSNLGNDDGIANRRLREAEVLNSTKCPLYSKPGEDPVPHGKTMRAKIKETVVPRGMLEKYPTTQNHEKYFVWRTMLDGNVRKEHRALEGKIFPKGYTAENPYNCRCDEEAVPGNVIIEKTDSEKAMEAALWRLHYNVLKLKALFERDAA